MVPNFKKKIILTIRNESSPLDSYSSIKESLATIKQTKAESRLFSDLVLRKTEKGMEVTPHDIVSSVSSSHRGSDDVYVFSKNMQGILKTLPTKKPVGLNYDITFLDSKEVEIYKSIGLKNANYKFSEIPNSADIVSKVVGKLDTGSHNIIPALDGLQQAADTHELLAFLCAAQVLAQLISIPVFLMTYSSFAVEGSFKFFLGQIRFQVESLLSPVKFYVRKTFDFVYKNKYKFVGGFSTIDILAYFFNHQTVKPIVLEVTTPVTTEVASEIVEVVSEVLSEVVDTAAIPSSTEISRRFVWEPSVWEPKNTYLVAVFDCAKYVWCSTSYMVSNFIVSGMRAGGEGAFDAMTKPDILQADVAEKAASVESGKSK